MGIAKEVRKWVHAHPRVRRVYLWLRFAPSAEMRKRLALLQRGSEWKQERQAVSRIADSGIYDLDLPLDNPTQSYQGRNFLGYPPMAGIRLGGTEIGWQFGQTVEFEDHGFPSYQVRTDLETNLPLLIDIYRPSFIVDFGTASGATAVLFSRLMRERGLDGRVLTVDINDPREGPNGSSLSFALDRLSVVSHIGDALSQATQHAVEAFLSERRNETVLLSFDDDHSAEHVLRELRTYSRFLRPGDAIVVQDTWDQGFRDTSLSPLLGVLRFLQESSHFELDVELLRKLVLPCSFVHGVIVKRNMD